MNSQQNSRSLAHKRILITDVENEFGKELYTSLRSEGCLLFTFVRELCRLGNVMKEFPDVVPVLLDPSGNVNKDQGHKLLTSFPSLDHVVNLSGDAGLEIISRALGSWRIHDFGENKTKPLISKMKDAGEIKNLIFHSSVGNQNLMSKLKANLNPRYTDSATAQVSTSVRKSFKKFFSSSSEPTSSQSATTTTTTTLSQSITSGNNHANDFATVAASLSQKKKPSSDHNNEPSSSSSSPSPRSTPPPSSTLTKSSSKVLEWSMPEKNDKIRSAVQKLNKKTVKKWEKLLKDMEKEQLSHLKQLDKNLNDFKKKEKKTLMAQNAGANAATVARSDVLSADTTNRIMASREARVDREVDKKVEARRDADTQKIAEDKKARMESLIGKLYHKTIVKQILEFHRIKEKYLV